MTVGSSWCWWLQGTAIQDGLTFEYDGRCEHLPYRIVLWGFVASRSTSVVGSGIASATKLVPNADPSRVGQVKRSGPDIWDGENAY